MITRKEKSDTFEKSRFAFSIIMAIPLIALIGSYVIFWRVMDQPFDVISQIDPYGVVPLLMKFDAFAAWVSVVIIFLIVVAKNPHNLE